jgi:hypothetical protein
MPSYIGAVWIKLQRFHNPDQLRHYVSVVLFRQMLLLALCDG